MGYDIQMIDKERTQLLVEQFKEGGRHPLDGNKIAWVSVTYNYAWFFINFLIIKKELGLYMTKQENRQNPYYRRLLMNYVAKESHQPTT